ncbi:hypothetical protein ACI2OX_03940 [Bacillus sp. N9]
MENIDQLIFMYSKTAGYSRFLFALSHLYALTKEPIFLNGTNMVIDYLKEHQHSLGGIEEADNPDPDRYGAEDTGVFRYNGEGIGDQLYTNNFMTINSWEAWKAIGDTQLLSFNQKLVDYISHIQIDSDKKEFNGGGCVHFI